MNYSFPETKFVKENDAQTQMKHIISEFEELMDTIEFTEQELEEAIDLYHSLETFFRRYELDGVDIETAFENVKQKNEARGYYK